MPIYFKLLKMLISIAMGHWIMRSFVLWCINVDFHWRWIEVYVFLHVI